MNAKNEKYELLFFHAKSSFDAELDRFKSIEEKASKFISLLSIAIAAYGGGLTYFMEQYLPPDSVTEWVFTIVVLFALLALASSWSLIFRSLYFVEMPRLPLDDETFRNIEAHNLATNHYLLSKTCQEGTLLARKAIDKKLELLRLSYTDIALSAWLI